MRILGEGDCGSGLEKTRMASESDTMRVKIPWPQVGIMDRTPIL